MGRRLRNGNVRNMQGHEEKMFKKCRMPERCMEGGKEIEETNLLKIKAYPCKAKRSA